ncbi:hypothetical protein ACFRCQ_12845 [Cytobacillus firmus]|uniref:hypothetical protein n=1 Tax=Cytobacillus firmus TaxID=1399 RepID=UPI0036C17379
METSDLKKTVMELLINLNTRIMGISELYKKYELINGYTRLGFLVEDLIVLINAIDNLVDECRNISIDELQEKLQFILDAMEENDPNLVSDLLIYELLPVIDMWRIELIDA